MQSLKQEDEAFPAEMDYSLFEATMQSYKTNSILPILKEELKLKIQTNRLASGKEELPKPIFKEPEKYELTAEEKKKREIRKQRNRVAAAKCRNRRKSQKESTKTTLAELELRNYTLKQTLADLEKEKEEYLKKLKQIGTLSNIFPSPQQISPPNVSVNTDEHQNENIPQDVFQNLLQSIPVSNTQNVDSNVMNIANVHDFSSYTEMKTSDEVSQLRVYNEEPNKENKTMEYMNWIPPIPQPCSSTCTVEESWTDDFFDEVDGDLFNMDTQDISDKTKDDSVSTVYEPQNPPRYFLPLIPVFDDEATVPGNVDNSAFNGRLSPTSPTFY